MDPVKTKRALIFVSFLALSGLYGFAIGALCRSVDLNHSEFIDCFIVCSSAKGNQMLWRFRTLSVRVHIFRGKCRSVSARPKKTPVIHG